MQNSTEILHKEIAPGQDTWNRLILSYWQANAVGLAVKLRLADLLSGGPLPVDELAARTDTHEYALYRLMRALESTGLFREIAPRVFAQTAMSEFLRSDVPGSQASSMLHYLGKGNGPYDAWTELEFTVRTGKNALEKIYGCDFWEFLRRNTHANDAMNGAMRSLSNVMTPAVATAYDWGRFPVIADIGGGIGSQIVAILDNFPTTTGILFDQSHVLANAIGHERLTVVDGNFFESVPQNADAYLLRFVLHDWSDKEAMTILRSVRQSMKPSASLILGEFIIPDGPGPDFSKWTDLQMMLLCRDARERTVRELEALLAETGFRLEEVVKTGGPVTLVVAQSDGLHPAETAVTAIPQWSAQAKG